MTTTPVVKPPKPDPFGGKREMADGWIFQLRLYFVAAGVPEMQQVAFAATLLREKTAVWWRNYINLVAMQQAPEITTFEEFAAQLLSYFKPANSTQTARDKLCNLRQTSSVATYTSTFQTLLLNIPDMGPADQIDTYIHGLKDLPRRECRISNPKTLLEAIQIADAVDTATYELEYRATPQRTYPVTSHTPNNTPPGPTPMDLDAAEAHPHAPDPLEVDVRGTRRSLPKLTEEERERL